MNEPNEILSRAQQIRAKQYGQRISISKSVFLPITKQCRNDCNYCGFVSDSVATWMTPDDIRATLRAGKQAEVGEALFTMGEKPEDKHESAREFLHSQQVPNIVEYTRDANEISLSEFQILPHSNPGVLTEEDLKILKPWNASMGLMLENSSSRFQNKGMPHENSPYKNPTKRKTTIELAGKMKIPFTSGILVGIGETREERIKSLLDLADMHLKYDHLQEIIVQNFQPLPNTPMENHQPLDKEEFILTVALARLILPEKVSIQVPPNLNQGRILETIQAGANDLGGVSPVSIDYVNYTSPWPKITELAEKLNTNGYSLVERLPVYPQYIKWTSPQIKEVLGEKNYYDYRSISN